MPTVRSRSTAKPKGPCTIVLVRHGQTGSTGKVLPGRAPGLLLSKHGHAQAERAAERIATLATAPSAVYASPLERAQQTAAPIARALKLRVRTERDLIECDFGEWTGARLSNLRKKPEWSIVQSAPSRFRFPGGESFAEMQVRAFGAIESLAARHRGETIVAVSHADPIKAVIAMAMGTPLDLFQRIVISTCSLSVLMMGEGAPIVLSVNAIGELRELVPS